MSAKKGLLILSIAFLSFFPAAPLFPQNADPGDDASGEGFEEDYEDDYLLWEEDEGLTVTGTPETTQQMEVIEKEDIEKHNAPDLAALLQEKLNLGFTRYGGRGSMGAINLRGFDSTRVALLVDGVPVNSAMNGEIDIDQIDLNSVERVEVIYGASDTKYNVSGALGGIINIVTVKRQKKSLAWGVSASNTSALPGRYYNRSDKEEGPNMEDLADTQNLSLNATYGGEGFSLTASSFANRAANHFLFTDVYGTARRKDNNEMWDSGASASFVWDFPSLTKLIASSNFFYSDKNVPTGGFSKYYALQQDLSTRHSLMLDMPRAFHDTLATEASVTYSFSDRIYEPPVGASSRHDQHTVSAINRWSWYPATSLTMRSGFDYRINALLSTDIGNRNRHDGGVYVTAEWSPTAWLMVIPSVKAAMASGGEGGVTPVPKLGFLWNINDSFTLKNNYFRSFKFPDFEDLFWSGGGASGNPNLRPEDGWGADIGVEWRFRELFQLGSSFFSQWVKDSIHWSSTNGTLRPENVGSAVFFGLDTKLAIDLPIAFWIIQKITLSLSHQYLLSYLLSYGYDFASDKRIPYQPMHTAGATLEFPWEQGSLIVSGHFESLRYADTANLDELEPYFLLNATVNQNIGKRLTVFAAARNILNQSYESYAGYPMPGLTLTIGVKAKFGVE